jgi:hypothetical protein
MNASPVRYRQVTILEVWCPQCGRRKEYRSEHITLPAYDTCDETYGRCCNRYWKRDELRKLFGVPQHLPEHHPEPPVVGPPTAYCGKCSLEFEVNPMLIPPSE